MKPNLDSKALTIRPNRLDSHVATLPAAGSSWGAAPAPAEPRRPPEARASTPHQADPDPASAEKRGRRPPHGVSQGPGPSGTRPILPFDSLPSPQPRSGVILGRPGNDSRGSVEAGIRQLREDRRRAARGGRSVCPHPHMEFAFETVKQPLKHCSFTELQPGGLPGSQESLQRHSMRERQRDRHRGNESLSLLSVITWVESYYRNQNTDQWPRKTADFSLSLVLHTQWKCFTQADSFEGGGGIV